MASNSIDHEEELKKGIVINPSPSTRKKISRLDRHSRHVSIVEEMSIIPESNEADFHHSSGRRPRPKDILLNDKPLPQAPASPSLFRRITTRLASPRLPSSGLPSPIQLTHLKSLRRSKSPGYENLQDAEDDYQNVPVDLSILSGLGFELTEDGQQKNEPWLDQDTTYQSPVSQSPNLRPDFQSFVKGRSLGDGLVVGAQLKRGPSINNSNLPGPIAEELKRNKTVRDAVQNDAVQKFAKERDVIVAVSESVDLSFLEGHDVRQRPTGSFDTMLNRSGTMEEEPQSYFFPQDPEVPNWRPITMSTPFILFLIAAAYTLAACQEFLCQKSLRLQNIRSGLLHFDDLNEVSVGVFFVWKYLPTMVTIIYAVFFSMMDFDIRRLEPFYQLSQPHGSPASESLNVDHLTMFQYFVPFKAIRLKQWTVFFSTIGNIIASTGSPALQNPSVDFRQNCDNDCSDTVKKYVVVIVPAWSRLLTTSYIIVGTIAAILFWQLRRKSGLMSDPKGIAGIASMATKSHILRDFKGTDLATRKDISKKLAHRRFVLYKSSIWQGQFNMLDEPVQESDGSLSSPHPPMLRLKAAVPFIVAQVLCLIAVPLISLTPANAIPNAAPWLPILIATILKLVWTTFEADVRLMEPFYQLSRGNAPPELSLTLDYQSTIYGYLPFKAAYNGHWLLCIVGLCSVSLDILSVTVASFSVDADVFTHSKKVDGEDPSNGPESFISFWTSVALSLIILTFVIFTTILVYHRRRHPFLPREPSTIASILAFIYASNMLEDFIDTERLTNKEMEQRLKRIGKRYALGWFRGRDNQLHCAIDQEPIRSKYVHGKPYVRAFLEGPLDTHGGYYA